MATQRAIEDMTTRFKGIWPNYKASRETMATYFDAFRDIPDDLLELATRKVIATCKATPVPAHVIEAANAARSEIIERDRREFASRQETQYPTYWERSPAERAEIDAARNECMRFVRSLSHGDGGTLEALARDSIRR